MIGQKDGLLGNPSQTARENENGSGVMGGPIRMGNAFQNYPSASAAKQLGNRPVGLLTMNEKELHPYS